MPKGKKQSLTQEEWLEQALVPESEWPYEVPGNWVWIRLEAFVKGINGYAFKSDEYIDSGIPIIRMGNVVGVDYIGKLNKCVYIATDRTKEFSKFLIQRNDLLMSLTDLANKGEFLGTVAIYDMQDKALLNQRVLKIEANENVSFNKFLFYLLRDINFRNYVTQPIGGSIQKNISSSFVFNAKVPLPPLVEQHRIVNRIENLFEKLDRAKVLVQSALDSFEMRKAAILHKAFTGELIGATQVRQCQLAEITQDIRIGPFGTMLHAEDYLEGGVPVINPKHISNQRIKSQEKVAVSKEKAAELSSYALKENDIILGRRGEMGRTAPITTKEEGWICGTGSMIIRLNKGYSASFYSAILSSQASVGYLEKNAVGSTMKNLNERIVKTIPVPDFSAEQQQEIVRILNSLLEKEQQVRQLADTIEKIDHMKKAILARAFRGELGTNEPEEESAIDLLKML